MDRKLKSKIATVNKQTHIIILDDGEFASHLIFEYDIYNWSSKSIKCRQYNNMFSGVLRCIWESSMIRR